MTQLDLLRGLPRDAKNLFARLLRGGGSIDPDDLAGTTVDGESRNHPGLDAHAWVEREGRPVGEGADVAERFAALG